MQWANERGKSQNSHAKLYYHQLRHLTSAKLCSTLQMAANWKVCQKTKLPRSVISEIEWRTVSWQQIDMDFCSVWIFHPEISCNLLAIQSHFWWECFGLFFLLLIEVAELSVGNSLQAIIGPLSNGDTQNNCFARDKISPAIILTYSIKDGIIRIHALLHFACRIKLCTDRNELLYRAYTETERDRNSHTIALCNLFACWP